MGCFVLFCAVIITDSHAVCKKLIPLGLYDCAADLPQPHFRDVAGGDAQGIDGGGRVEFVHMGELIGRKILVCPQAEAGHQHIGHADLQRISVERLQIEVIQFLQQAVLPALPQVLQVVREVVRHGVMAGGAHGVRQIFFFGQVAEGGLQRFDDLRLKGRVHRPDGQRTGKTGRMGIGNIKIELQAVLPVIAKYGDALGSTVDPAAKLTVPSLHLKDRRGIRALCVDQNLIIKGTFVVIAGGTEKARPALIAAGDAFQRMLIQLGDELKFGRQVGTSYLSGSARFFTASRSFFCCSFWAFSNGFR